METLIGAALIGAAIVVAALVYGRRRPVATLATVTAPAAVPASEDAELLRRAAELEHSTVRTQPLAAARTTSKVRPSLSAPPRRTRFAAAGTSLRAWSFCATGTLSSRSSWMQSAPRVWALSTYFSTLAGTYIRERQTGRSGFTGDNAFLRKVLDF